MKIKITTITAGDAKITTKTANWDFSDDMPTSDALQYALVCKLVNAHQIDFRTAYDLVERDASAFGWQIAFVDEVCTYVLTRISD